MISNEKKQSLIAALDTAGYDVTAMSDGVAYTPPMNTATDQIQITIKPKSTEAQA